MSVIKQLDLTTMGDERGSLIALEAMKTIPFDIKRVYYIFGTKPGVPRGFHAHRASQQMLVCVTGKCRIVVDDGKERDDVWLDSPAKGLLIDAMVWREMHDFSSDCVLLVLTNEHYDPTGYIRDYSEFLKRLGV